MNQGRLVGLILMAVGAGLTVMAGLFLAVRTGEEDATMLGTVLGAGLAFMIVAPLIGFGFFMWIKGGQDAEQESEMQKQRQLLDIVKSRGQVRVDEVALEMSVPVDSVRNMVHQLVGLQVFTGYINWDDGILFSSEASKLRDLENCEKCGGRIQLAGRGIVQCPFCGTEYFL
ncbi:MAG: hypothetical protein EA396_13635 [Anaerolineaceae bacterium]|nr:MAG: hypothetical protein EA396_13635 [Anaerolineaceae bacterium]